MLKTKTQFLKKKISRSQIYSICEDLVNNIPRLLTLFNISYIEFDNRVAFSCPVHGGDNPEGACIFTSGSKTKGNWQCWTHSCEKDHGKNIIGFVKGVLENKKGKEVSFPETIDFCLKFLDKKIDEIPEEELSETIHQMNRISDILTHKPEIVSTNVTRDMIVSGLEIPSKYYVKRGYKPDTLVAFDVGECYNPNKQMFNRAVVPVYDENHNYIGCVGRTLEEHNKKYKWINSKGFKKSFYLYGLWVAKQSILDTSTVVLVEGQGDVWRLYEAGIKNSVGIFGADLSDDQLIALESLSIFNVVILTDADEAGNKAANNIIEKCGRRFNYYRPNIPTKDVGDMTVEQIEHILKPQIKGLF